MATFEEKMDGTSSVFHHALVKFNEETEPHILEIIAKQISFADEFEKASANIEIAC